MTLDEQIKKRAIEVLERMGFTRTGDTDEWCLTDGLTSSMFSVEFQEFDTTDLHPDRGFWRVSSWSGIYSESGGPLATDVAKEDDDAKEAP